MESPIIIYPGTRVSLGLMQRSYGPAFVRFTNRYGHLDGVRLRPPYYLSDFEKWFKKITNDPAHRQVFAILEHGSDGLTRTYRYVGHTSIHNISATGSHGATGTIIGDPNAHGKGYGKEAKLLLQQHAFDALGLHSLQSLVKSFNAASLGHLIACGYRIWGRRHEVEPHKGELIDQIHLECFRRDWEPIWEEYRKTNKLPTLSDEQRALVRKETNT